MRKMVLALVGGLALLLAGVPAWAHHAFAAEFDADKPVKIRGTVVKWELINPHSWLQIDAKGEDGKVTTWRFEGPPEHFVQTGFHQGRSAARHRGDRRGISGEGWIHSGFR